MALRSVLCQECYLCVSVSNFLVDCFFRLINHALILFEATMFDGFEHARTQDFVLQLDNSLLFKLTLFGIILGATQVALTSVAPLLLFCQTLPSTLYQLHDLLRVKVRIVLLDLFSSLLAEKNKWRKWALGGGHDRWRLFLVIKLIHCVDLLINLLILLSV